MNSFWIIYIQNICDKISFLSLFGCVFCLAASVLYGIIMYGFKALIVKILFTMGIIFGLITIFVPTNIEKTYIKEQQDTISKLTNELIQTKEQSLRYQINNMESGYQQ